RTHKPRKIGTPLCRVAQATEEAPSVTKPTDSWQRAAPPLISRAMENILPILIADAPEALIELCGVNLLERLLRILQRLGFRRAIVFSTTPEIVEAELAKRSWAREQVIIDLIPCAIGPLTAQLLLEQSPSERFLIVPADIYYY